MTIKNSQTFIEILSLCLMLLALFMLIAFYDEPATAKLSAFTGALGYLLLQATKLNKKFLFSPNEQ